MRDDIKKIISENRVCVLATALEGEPHCSLMSYATDDTCREIFMATLRHTRKYRNLIANPSVSLLIDTRESGVKEQKGTTRALTLTGVVQAGLNEEKKLSIRKELLKRHPELKAFLDDPDVEVVMIRATALQLLDGITDAYFEQVL